MEPKGMRAVIGGVRYDTEKAEVIASDCYWDGHNWERHGRNAYLYKTPNGRYFAVYLTMWEGERDRIEPLPVAEALELYEQLPVKVMEFEEAFPGEVIEEA